MDNPDQLQQAQIGDRTPTTTIIATNVPSQDLSPPAQDYLAKNNTIAREQDIDDTCPNTTASTCASTCDTTTTLESPPTEVLTPRTRRRRWVMKRPLTPITTMKSSQPTLERYVSPRRPFAPVNMKQRQTSSANPATESMRQNNAMLRMGSLPKPWPRSMSGVDRSNPSRRDFSAALCQPDADCSSNTDSPDGSLFSNS